jgi:hypothetical protein
VSLQVPKCYPLCPVPQHAIQAPDTATRCSEIQEDETPGRREVTSRADRPESFRGVDHEIRYRHLAGEDKGDRSGEETYENKKAAEELQKSAQAHKREEGDWRHLWCGMEAEEFLRTVLGIEKAGHDPQDAENTGRPPVKELTSIRHRKSPLIRAMVRI